MIEKIALLTDSACDLPKEFIERFCIKVLPLSVIYPDKIYQDRITINPRKSMIACLMRYLPLPCPLLMR